MPIYEFICKKCGYHFEHMVAGMSCRAAPACRECGGATKKQFSVFSAHSGSSHSACGQSPDNCQMASGDGCPGGSCPYSS